MIPFTHRWPPSGSIFCKTKYQNDTQAADVRAAVRLGGGGLQQPVRQRRPQEFLLLRAEHRGRAEDISQVRGLHPKRGDADLRGLVGRG